MESVLGVHEHQRGFDRSISGCVCQCVTTMLYSPLINPICNNSINNIYVPYNNERRDNKKGNGDCLRLFLPKKLDKVGGG